MNHNGEAGTNPGITKAPYARRYRSTPWLALARPSLVRIGARLHVLATARLLSQAVTAAVVNCLQGRRADATLGFFYDIPGSRLGAC